MRRQHDHGRATMNHPQVRLSLSAASLGLMKMVAIALAIAWTTSSMVPGQQIGRESGAVAKVRELEYARFEAQRRRNNLALDAMFDNALVWVEPNGVRLTKADYLANLRKPGITIVEIGPESMTVRLRGTTAIVVGIYRERGMKDGQAYMLRARFLDTWVFKNGRWLCIAAAATSSIS